ncbi:uncharacterized protein BJ212DRAFT_1296105 [Suillus subaureus]|uniref:Uncharacterized protein n=1 Tax=Suillus subaureus TaxID=48587 RepID=A0A9P7JHS3_9AGAM|nr:uncharacterized protein BJ212DRAFT_1296105 [Suillus subaureus]KAG1823483.1 hypothetical protein BJ212DRAFT_1296105 [Suillus subaureus]
MFQCPLCCKNGFSTHEAVTRHMSQPRSGCSTWIEDVICLKTIIQPSEDDPINVNQESFVHDDYYSASYDDTNIQAAGGLFEEEHVPASHNKFLNLFLGSAEVYGGGYMFLGLSMGKIDSFLSLEMIKALSLSFHSAKELQGDDAWNMQSVLPDGATLLGIMLSSDKTTISALTGDRVVHPLIISLVKISMNTCTKISSDSFLLTALLLVPKFIHKKKCMWGVLEDRLIHQCLDIILELLKRATCVGVMMLDPMGNSQHCYTGLKFRLNGVAKPFWCNWILAKPSHFFTPELLHHIHWEFWDHNAKWLINALGESEIDFCFSILSHITGLQHFHGGILKLKQVTGQCQHNIQCYIIAVCANAAPQGILTAIHTFMDFYLECISAALNEFHAHKDTIITASLCHGEGKKVITNWHIPKLEFMQSIVLSIHNTGVPMQWTADTTEHAHITVVKVPAQSSNNNNYELQICCHLDFDEGYEGDEGDEGDANEDIPVDLLSTVAFPGHSWPIMNCFMVANSLCHKDVGTVPQPLHMFTVGWTAFHLAYSPSIRSITVDEAATYDLPSLIFSTTMVFMGNIMSIHVIQPAQTLNCTPPCDAWPWGCFDTVLINTCAGFSWPASGFQGHSMVQIRLIMRLLTGNALQDCFLTYIHCFDSVTLLGSDDRDLTTQLHVFKRAKRSNGTCCGNSLLVTSFIMAIVAQTVMPTIKLGSFPVMPHSHNITTMNKLTSKELDHLVTHEDPKGIRLDNVPLASELKIKLGKLQCSKAAKVCFQNFKDNDMVPLYDINLKCWNWDFPSSGITPVVHMQIFTDKFATHAVPTQDIQQKPDLVLSNHVVQLGWNNFMPAAHVGSSMDTKAYLLFHGQPWCPFVLLLSFCNQYHDLRIHLYNHSGGLVSPVFNINNNPDIYLQILTGIVFGGPQCLGYDCTIVFYVTPSKSTSTSHCTATSHQAIMHDISKDISSLAPGITKESHPSSSSNDSVAASGGSNFSKEVTHYDPPTDMSHEGTLVEFFEDGPFSLYAPFASTTGVLQPEIVPEPNENIPTALFPPPPSNKDPISLMGRGTVCYLVKLGGEEFIIKDHWVQGQDDMDILNEVGMLKWMQGVPGIPHLEDYWIVEREKGVPDTTGDFRFKHIQSISHAFHAHVHLVLKPCAHPLHQFQTKKEQLTALCDIICIIPAASDCGVVHCDCSLHNAMIEDLPGGIQGCLINWEFAINVSNTHCDNNTHSILTRGGTGTVPFMSCKLLSQLVQADLAHLTQPISHKTSSTSAPPQPLATIVQNYSDDLESILWIFLWVLLNYLGPLRMEWNQAGLMTEGWNDPNTTLCVGSKYVLYHSGKAAFLHQIDPYFMDLTQLTDDWLELMRHNDEHLVAFNAVLELLDSFLSNYKTEEFSPERYFLSQELKIPLGENTVRCKRVIPESKGTYFTQKQAKAVV